METETETEHQGGDWQAAAGGLGTYRSGVIAQLVLTCIMVSAIGLALLSKNPGMLSGLGLVLPIAAIGATIMMIVGLSRYAGSLPPPSNASGPAIGAVILMVLGLLLSIYAYSIVWRMHSYQSGSGGGSYRDLKQMIELAKNLPWVEMIAGVAGLIALLLVIASLRGVARWIDRRDLEARAGTLAVGVTLLAIFATGLRFYLASLRRPPSVGLLIVLGVAALVWALVTIVQYIGLLREVADAVEHRKVDLPSARIAR